MVLLYSMKLPSILKLFSPKRIILAVSIGLAVALFLVFRDFDISVYKNINWTWYATLWLILSIGMMGMRDLAYMYRIRILTDNQLSWRRCFDVVMLWEFASSITPTQVGGSAVALFILSSEKLKAGRSTAIVLMTSFLDELFFIIMVPIVFLVIGMDRAFPTVDVNTIENAFYGKSLFYLFQSAYVMLFGYTVVIAYGLLINPRGFKWLLLKITSLPVLRKKWRKKAGEIGDDIVVTSMEFRKKSFSFWLNAFGATVFSWTARYMMVNCLMIAFDTSGGQMMIYGRQLVMWIILLVTPTPGGSGVAEVIFPVFLGEFLSNGIAASVALLWRLLSYYPYLIIGAIILPRWLRRVLIKKED